MATKQSVTLAFRVAPEKATALEKLSESTDRDKSWLLERALDEYLVNQAWQIQAVEEGLAEAEARHLIPHDKVRAWLQSWGKDDELAPPS